MEAPDNNLQEDGGGTKLQLHQITLSDLEDVAGFIRRESGSLVPLPIALARLSWILRENPARVPEIPLGWCLRTSAGEIAGCLCCAPQNFCSSHTSVTLIMANSFYVSPQYRGAGTAIFLKYLQLGRKYPLFVSSANPTVAEMWRKLGAHALVNSEHEVIGILRWSGVMAETAYRKTGSNFVASLAAGLVPPRFRVPRSLLAGIREGHLHPLSSAEEAAAVCAQHHSEKTSASRDLPFLSWRYFSRADPTIRLFAFRSSDYSEKQLMIAVCLQNRGYKQQIRALHVLDIWGEVEANRLLEIAASLCREYHDRIDILVFRCLDPAHLAALLAHGFRVRSFAAPIAWCLDKAGLLLSPKWYFTPADGDMFL